MNTLLSQVPGIERATVREQMEMIDDLWELVRRSGEVPMNTFHLPELQRRTDKVMEDPSIALSPEDARALLKQ